MIPLKDIMAYYCKDKPLSKARLNKLIYLADWKSSLDREEQLTNLQWFFDHYGPYLSEIASFAERDKDFSLSRYGQADLISYRGSEPNIPASDKQILDFVKNATSKMDFKDFIKFVYSTYPVRTTPQYNVMNLVNLARNYKSQSTT